MSISEIFKVLYADLLKTIDFKCKYQYFINVLDFLLCCYIDKIMQIDFPNEYIHSFNILTNDINNYQFFYN